MMRKKVESRDREIELEMREIIKEGQRQERKERARKLQEEWADNKAELRRVEQERGTESEMRNR